MRRDTGFLGFWDKNERQYAHELTPQAKDYWQPRAPDHEDSAYKRHKELCDDFRGHNLEED